MRSEVVGLRLHEPSEVCARGAVLELRPSGVGFEGTCKRCPAGSYSLAPLTGSRSAPEFPACLPCPAGGVCRGGSDVSFALGEWAVEGARFVLRSCPATHERVAASAAGEQDAQ
eukprot:2555870-Rhodomonas_salina.1